MDDKTYRRLFGETPREMRNRHNGLLIYCPTCKHGFTSKRNLKSHDCADRQKWNAEEEARRIAR